MSAQLSELDKIVLPVFSNDQSAHNTDRDRETNDDGLYWYFGYGSNLNSETFLVKRGIRPLRQRHLIVPGWRLNFEIAGIPYAEPGFGSIDQVTEEEASRDPRPILQGMAYLVTSSDYEHIIVTEGGNASYRQIQIDTYDIKTKESLKVWSLQAIRPRRLCQPSVRYINIIRNGAREHGFSQDYVDYLDAIEPFVLHGKRQKLGAAIFLGFWMPIIAWLFATRALLIQPNGTVPQWLATFTEVVFGTLWTVHDSYWAKTFGRGDHNKIDGEQKLYPREKV